MRHMKILRVAVVGFALLAVTVLVGGIAFAAPGPGRDGGDGGNPPDTQRAEGTFDQGPAALASGSFRDATGEFRLEVRMDGFKFEAKGEGILTTQDITFCVGTTNIDTDNPEGGGRWEGSEDDRLDLVPQVVPVITSGTVVTIQKEVTEDQPCVAPVVMGIVAETVILIDTLIDTLP